MKFVLWLMSLLIVAAFHWTDLPISYNYGFLPGLIFSILKH